MVSKKLFYGHVAFSAFMFVVLFFTMRQAVMDSRRITNLGYDVDSARRHADTVGADVSFKAFGDNSELKGKILELERKVHDIEQK